ncbi:MAG TPA: hypothetical protein EYH06_12585 [Chromatiales bacterium]|nr:hypothetical protein [Thiotrichales bacterium]HIP69400.1 hypothetical protein [Chromatiales bacterium]
MKAQVLKALATCLVVSMSQNVLAASGQATHKPDGWLMKMIYQPIVPPVENSYLRIQAEKSSRSEQC